jgi:hypothetical protein
MQQDWLNTSTLQESFFNYIAEDRVQFQCPACPVHLLTCHKHGAAAAKEIDNLVTTLAAILNWNGQ